MKDFPQSENIAQSTILPQSIFSEIGHLNHQFVLCKSVSYDQSDNFKCKVCLKCSKCNLYLVIFGKDNYENAQTYWFAKKPFVCDYNFHLKELSKTRCVEFQIKDILE
jgi:hypothetical protein